MQQVKDRDVLWKQKHIPMGFLAAWLMVITTIQWIMLNYKSCLKSMKRGYE